MPKFFAFYENISITVGIALGSSGDQHFFTLYLKPEDWSLRDAIVEFRKSHETSCKLVTKHSKDAEPFELYHEADSLIREYGKMHTHFRYNSPINAEQFAEWITLIVKTSEKSLGKTKENIERWKNETIHRFKQWCKTNYTQDNLQTKTYEHQPTGSLASCSFLAPISQPSHNNLKGVNHEIQR